MKTFLSACSLAITCATLCIVSAEVCSPVDVVIVVDGSVSVGFNNFQSLKSDLISLANQIVSDNGLHIGVVVYSTSVDENLGVIRVSGDLTELSTQINRLSYPSGNTLTDLGINRGIQMLRYESRQGLPKKMIVITDGYSNIPGRTASSSVLAKRFGIEMFAVGIGPSVHQTELEAIASTTLNVETATNFNSVRQSLAKLTNRLCGVPVAILTPIPQPFGCSAADVVLVIDGSKSVQLGNFESLKRDLVRLVQQIGVSDTGIRIGVVVYSSTINEFSGVIRLSGNPATLTSQIQQLHYPSQNTLTNIGIDRGLQMLRTANRPGAAQKLVVITDGYSNLPTATTSSANFAQLNGVEMFALGVGPYVYLGELNSIASNNINVQTATGFDNVYNSLLKISREFCDIIPVTTTVIPTTTLPLKPTVAIPFGCSADIVFIVDSSDITKFGNLYNNILSALVQFTTQFVISDSRIRVGAVFTNDTYMEEIPLSGNRFMVGNQIGFKKNPFGGRFSLSNGLKSATNIFQNDALKRGSPRVAVIIAGSASNDNPVPFAEATNLKSVPGANAVSLVSLGVESVFGIAYNGNELNAISSAPLRHVPDSSALLQEFNRIAADKCGDVIPTQPVPTPPAPTPPATTPPAPTPPATTPPAPTPPVTISQPNCALDMVLVVDSSDITKSGDFYFNVISSLRQYITQENISNGATRIGIVFMNETHTVKIPLSGDRNFLLSELDKNVNPLGGGLLISTGLIGATEVFNMDTLNRNVPRTTVVLTASRSRGGNFPFFAANSLKNLKGGNPVSIHSVGIQSPNGILYDPYELNLILSKSGTFQQVTNPTLTLPEIRNINKDECEETNNIQSCNPKDIVLVVDGSQSVGNASFELLKSKMIDFTRQLSIGPGEINVAVVVYSSDVKNTGLVPLTDNRSTLELAIANLPYPEQGTMTHIGIQFGHAILQGSTRPTVDKVMVVITDGYSEELPATVNAANAAKQDGITIFAIGVGSGVNDQELFQIASDPLNVQKVTNFNAVIAPFVRISRGLCDPVCLIDVVFVVDSSDVTLGGDIYTNFVQSIKAFIRQQAVSDTGTRVGVVFTNDIDSETQQIPLSGNEQYLVNELNMRPKPLGKGLLLRNGLNEAIDVFTAAGNRNAHRVAFVLSAGRSKSGQVPVIEANKLKNLPGSSPVIVHSFGVSSPAGVLYNINELNTIASHPLTNVYEINAPTTLPDKFNQIVDGTCSNGSPQPATTQVPPTVVPACNPRDIVLVVDASQSIGEKNFEALKTNMVAFTRQLEISPYDANVGVVLYSSDVPLTGIVELTGNAALLESSINSLPYLEGGTQTDDGINRGLTILQSGRPGEDKIMIVITDGNSYNIDDTVTAAQRAKSFGIVVYALGIGQGASDFELNQIASGPSYVHKATDFNSVLNSLLLVSRGLCDPIPTVTDIPTTAIPNTDPKPTVTDIPINSTTVTPNADCTTPLDLVLVVDGSTSVGSGSFETLKQTLTELLPQLNSVPDRVHVGVVLYSDLVDATLPLTGDFPALSADILQLKFPTGTTHTDLGINQAVSVLRAGRFVDKKIIVITDGDSTNKLATKNAAADAKAVGVDMHVLAVGGGVSNDELFNIASSPSQILVASNFDKLGLSAAFSDLVNSVCN